MDKNIKIAIIGLGYVGLPMAVEFGKKYNTVGFDINEKRVKELQSGHDHTLEVDEQALRSAERLLFASSQEEIADCKVYIIAVPTPINDYKQPDLTPLLNSSRLVGEVLQPGDIVIYESTVYPGATEEECVPVLEQASGLKFNQDFFCGYSPERINPGDKEHTFTKIIKITSGSTPQTADFVDELYNSVLKKGTYKASSIKVAEAAKVIENTQRDLNIAFVNELALIFDRLNIDTREVLAAAGTKWNFLNFQPGLVGGHCIGVDPYYLLHKANAVGYHPEIITAGRRLNDDMGMFIANKLVKLMIKKGHRIEGARVLVLGITFKENCPDMRNSKVLDVINELQEFGCKVDVYDPWVDLEATRRKTGFNLIPDLRDKYDGIVLAVAHQQFLKIDWSSIKYPDTVIYDVKGVLKNGLSSGRL